MEHVGPCLRGDEATRRLTGRAKTEFILKVWGAANFREFFFNQQAMCIDGPNLGDSRPATLRAVPGGRQGWDSGSRGHWHEASMGAESQSEGTTPHPKLGTMTPGRVRRPPSVGVGASQGAGPQSEGKVKDIKIALPTEA